MSWWIRYHTGIPNIKLGRLKVAMTGLLMTLDGGKRKGIVWTEMSPDNSLIVACGDAVVVAAA